MQDLHVEPEYRMLRAEERVRLEHITKQLEDCICARPGMVAEELLAALEREGYDQAPVDDPGKGICWGLVHRSHLLELYCQGQPLETDDPHVIDRNKEFRVGADTSIYQLVHKMSTEPAVIVVQEGDAEQYGTVAVVRGLLTVADLNRHEVRAVIYRLFSDVEEALADRVEMQVPEPWDWIRLLGEDQQVRILGYWDLAKRRDVDIGPIAAATLTNLLVVVSKTPALLAACGYPSAKKFQAHYGRVPEFRNRIMHPVRPLVLDLPDVKELYLVLRFLEALKNSLLTDTVHEQPA